MKKRKFLTTLMVVLFSFTSLIYLIKVTPAYSRNSEIERRVFVHYPKIKGGKVPLTPTDQVTDYKYTRIHWLGTNPRVTYYVNPQNNKGVNVATAEVAIDSAFATWDSADTSGNDLTFIDGGITTKNITVNPSMDFSNTVSWEPLGSTYPSAIAVTYFWYYRTTKELVEVDTLLNEDLPWSVNPYGTVGFSSFDVQNITTHEVGHWLVLGDLYKWRDSELTMYGYASMGETKKDTLGTGDILGINRIYP